MQQSEPTLPPADDLTTDELARVLCHRVLPGATSTSLLGDEWIEHHQYGVPRSWMVQAHKEARRRRPQDDGTKHLAYHEHGDREILESLSVKLEFDLEVIDAAADGAPEELLAALYDGLREFE